VLLTLAALVVLWIPGLSIVGALLLSIGSTLIFWGRRKFGDAHRVAVAWAYALFWAATAVYAVVFIAFIVDAYNAWLDFETMGALQAAAVVFVWDSTVPTELVVIAVALQVRGLLPPGVRRQSAWAGAVLGLLVLLATVLAYLDLASGIGSEFVRMASVVGLLNRISVARLVEGPGFAWLAYLYYRARGNIAPKAAPGDSAAATA